MNELTFPNNRRIYYLDKLTAKYVYNEIFEEEVYFQHGISVKEGDVIFDIGANIGIFSQYIAEKAPDLQIYTFEPIPTIFEVLKANLAETPNIVKNYNIGLGEKDKECDFYYYPKVSADSTAVPFDFEYKVAKYVENYKERVCETIPIARIVPKFLRKKVVSSFLRKMYQGEKVNCSIKTLSGIIKENEIDQIDLMKIDAENAEKEVLAGIDDNDWDKIQQITMETHEHIKGGEGLTLEIVDLLESKDFNVNLGEEGLETRMGVFMLYARK